MDAESSSDLDRNNCTTHGLKIKFFCKTHSLLGCVECMFREHKLCEDVSEISEDIDTTRKQLSRIRSDLSKETDKLTEQKRRAKTVCSKTIDNIDSVKKSLIDKIEEGIFDCKRLVLSKEKEVEESIDTHLADLVNFDHEVQAVINKLHFSEMSMNCDDICECFEKTKRYEIIGREKIQTVIVVSDLDFNPSEICNSLLEKPINLGLVTGGTVTSTQDVESDNNSTGGDSQTKGDDVSKTSIDTEHKFVQTQSDNEILEQLSENMSRIKQNGAEVVMCFGQLIIAEKEILKSVDFSRKKTLFQVKMESSPSNLITVGNKYVAVVLRQINIVKCYRVEKNGKLLLHRKYCDDNNWKDVLTIAEGRDGFHILATIKCFETSDFKHPTTLTRVHKLFL